MTALPSHTHPIRGIAIVPGMREIGWAYGLRFCARSELIGWGAHSLPRGTTARTRIRAAQAWLEGIIEAKEVQEILLVLPDPHHLTQRKNLTDLPRMVEALCSQVKVAGSSLRAIQRRELKDRLGRPTLPDHFPTVTPRARWALAAVHCASSMSRLTMGV